MGRRTEKDARGIQGAYSNTDQSEQTRQGMAFQSQKRLWDLNSKSGTRLELRELNPQVRGLTPGQSAAGDEDPGPLW